MDIRNQTAHFSQMILHDRVVLNDGIFHVKWIDQSHVSATDVFYRGTENSFLQCVMHISSRISGEPIFVDIRNKTAHFSQMILHDWVILNNDTWSVKCIDQSQVNATDVFYHGIKNSFLQCFMHFFKLIPSEPIFVEIRNKTAYFVL